MPDKVKNFFGLFSNKKEQSRQAAADRTIAQKRRDQMIREMHNAIDSTTTKLRSVK